ncbi:DUF7002 family protein [Nitrospirillum sp. BR 11163]|uniref:DUF7002 family protein n=1 Tax=Nitrospirillum sp. BR 11163 TaxID=3104323 RepID=UPI002AFE9394|nr:hypothetical protein [Nitrospirillum sp. BR 11163]MEA1672834.1 hypothetical protein [Nitrospirillum sp. BR 11163]
MSRLDTLYHLAEEHNLPSIMAHGLLSTERLLDLAGITGAAHTAVLRNHRPDAMQLSANILVRDQRPMPPAALAKALDDGLTTSDWYALLNSFVFLWPDRDRLERQRIACGPRPQVILVFDGAALFDAFGDQALLSPINSGNARRRPARRGKDTFVPYSRWLRQGWPTGQRTRPPAEVLFGCGIPVQPPYLLNIIRP